MRDTKNSLYYYIFHTQYGYLGLASSDKGLRAVVLPQKNKNLVYKKLISNLNDKEVVLVKNKVKLNNYYVQILGYFNGISKSFRVKLDLQGYSDFSKKVWEITQEIPYGETRSYSWIAERFCSPDFTVRNIYSRKKIPGYYLSRAVGNALGKNPIPIIIPCHRVLKKDGSLGGFSSGLSWKRFLLDLEKNNMRKYNCKFSRQSSKYSSP